LVWGSLDYVLGIVPGSYLGRARGSGRGSREYSLPHEARRMGAVLLSSQQHLGPLSAPLLPEDSPLLPA